MDAASNVSIAGSSTSSPTAAPKAKNRLYTCPLDQVVQELDAAQHDSASFSRLFTDHEGSELQFSQSVFEMMNQFSQSVFSIAFDNAVEPDHHDERIPLMTWQTCAFTVQAVVWSVLDQGRSIFGQMSSRHSDCLSRLVRFCGVVGSNFGEPKIIRSHALKLLSTLLEVDSANASVLEVDAFGLLVAFTFSLPSLFNEHQGEIPFDRLLTLWAHFLKILLFIMLKQN